LAYSQEITITAPTASTSPTNTFSSPLFEGYSTAGAGALSLEVRVAIQNPNGEWWDGSAWGTVQTFLTIETPTATQNASWNCILSNSPLPTDPAGVSLTDDTHPEGYYYLIFRMADSSGNVADDYRWLNYDRTAPSVVISAPQTSQIFFWSLGEASPSGTSADQSGAQPSGVVGVYVRIQSPNGNYWDGSSWVSMSTYLSAVTDPPTLPPTPTSATVDWMYDLSDVSLDGWGTYTISVFAADDAGNESSIAQVSFRMIKPNEKKEGIASCGGSVALTGNLYGILLLGLFGIGILITRIKRAG
jgi:hypothetical protein